MKNQPRTIPVAMVVVSLASVLLTRARCAPVLADPAPPRVVVGAKNFTEGAILGELMAQAIERRSGAQVDRRFNLAGTQVAFEALRTGAIDLYAEYTGTGLREILGDTSPVSSAAQAFARVSEACARRYDLLWLAPFGFNNTYVLMMRSDRAQALDVATIGAAAAHPLRYGVSHEFLDRADGMPGLRRLYGLDVSRRHGARSGVPCLGRRGDRRVRRLLDRRQDRHPAPLCPT